MKTGGYIERRTPLENRRWGVKPAPTPADNWRETFMPAWMNEPDGPKYTPFEIAWFVFVRTLPCCAGHMGRCRGPIQAAHVALSADQKGHGMKVPHDQTVPLCKKHHDDWDGRNGYGASNPFAEMSKDDRYELAGEWVDDVHEAATPGDSRADAEELERLGLGKVIGNGRDSWSWLPGPLTEVDPSVLGDVRLP